MKPLVCLASASPRRRELLAQIGVPYEVAVAGVDEAARHAELPHDYVQRMAREKALAVVERARGLPILAADTVVVLDGSVYGKPRDRQHALEMLARLSARTHEVLTAVVLVDARGLESRMSVSSVRFRALTAEECAAYWETGEPRDKAGGYAIQGLGAVFVESLAGSHSGVMGLPLHETAALLRSAGVPCWCKMTE